MLLALAWVFVPVYISSGVSSQSACPSGAFQCQVSTHPATDWPVTPGRYNSVAILPWRLTNVCSDRDHAGVPGPTLRRGEDQNVPGCPFAAAVRLHQDISRTHSSGLPAPVSHLWSRSMLGSMMDALCPLPRPTSTLGPCSFRCVWAGTCTCPPSSCWWSPLFTLSQVNHTKQAETFPYFSCGILIFHGYFRRSRCCYLHRHSPNVCDDSWSHHPDHHGLVYGTLHKKNKPKKNPQTLHLCTIWGWCPPSTAFNKIGGFGNLEHVYSLAVPSKIIPNSTCHLPRQDAMHLFRDAVTGDLPWPGMTLGLTILATWYWCSDQVHTENPVGLEGTIPVGQKFQLR